MRQSPLGPTAAGGSRLDPSCAVELAAANPEVREGDSGVQ